MPFYLFAAGGALVATGAWMAYHPAGPIVGGAIMIFLAIRLTGAQNTK